jgi:hypothetical protein
MPDDRMPPNMATLNEVIDLLGALKAGNLGRLIAGGTGARYGTCETDCSCNFSMCGCRGLIQSTGRVTINFHDFMKLREERLAELKREMQSLEIPPDLK